MKIFVVAMNYGGHNKVADSALYNGGIMSPDGGDPVIFTKVDSALLKDHKPFFVPDDMGRIDCEASLVVRICRLGKAIPERFAHRYYDAVTVGVDFTAGEMLEEARRQGLPWTLCKGFDGSAVIGDWVPLEQPVSTLDFRLEQDETVVQQGLASDMRFSIDELIAYLSRFFTLKTGDLIFTGTPTDALPVAVGHHLQGYIGQRKVLDFYCR